MISFNGVAGVRTLFLRCIALTYSFAFYSLYTQIPGLYGDRGILPASGQIKPDLLETSFIKDVLWRTPSLLYFSSSLGLSITQLMEVFCLVGTILGLLLTVKPSLNTKPVFFLMWIFYLSICKAGNAFLWFQWDRLLTEVGFLALILAPTLPGQHRVSLPQDPINMFLIRWLLFRMMFASGVVKLTSMCPTWWGLTAMPTHYFSQCIPTPLAWFASLMPDWMHKLSVASTFVIEIPLTFFFFAPTTSIRKFTFFNQMLLMVVIMLTGNYNFFNFVYMALCLSLADDTWILGSAVKRQHPVTRCICCLLHLAVYLSLGLAIAQNFNLKINSDLTIDSSVAFTEEDFERFVSYAVPGGVLLGLVGLAYSVLIAAYISIKDGGIKSLLLLAPYILTAAVIFGISLPSFTGQLDRPTYDQIPKSIKSLDSMTSQFDLTSSYGLFRRMTGVGGRPEIVIEGSNSIKGPWLEYRFLYKPGDVTSAPKFCLPHQPRLDWQMWFAALGSYQQNPWFVSLIQRLLEGEGDVLRLLDSNTPFRDKPPQFIRAKLYKYTFTGWGSADWWVRTFEREYLPVLSLNDKLDQVLTENGIIGSKSTPGTGVIPDLLKLLRGLSDQFPPHLQIWSFAWLALPLIKPMFVV